MRRNVKNWTSLFALVTAIVLVGAACTTPQASANPTNDVAVSDEAPNRAAIGVRSERHVKVSLLTAKQMLEGTGGYKAEQVAIVVCGDGVESLVEGGELDEELRDIQRERPVSIVACGLTVERKGIEPDSLVEGIEVVPNGFIELARLQGEGYESVEL